MDTRSIDQYGADSRRAQRASLSGPLKAGFEIDEFPLDAAGQVQLPAIPSRSTLFVRLLADHDGTEPLVVTAAIGAGEPVQLAFEPLAPAGASLHVGVIDTDTTATVALVGAGDLATTFTVDRLSGNFGHLVTLLSLEQQRLHAHARAVARSRTIAGAHGAMLDRIGAELGVKRFDSALAFTGGAVELSGGPENREDDQHYRDRLRLFRRRRFPTPPDVLAQLKEIHPDFQLEERERPYENAMRLVSVADTEPEAQHRLAGAFETLRRNWLIDPAGAPPVRPIGNEERKAEAERHARLKDGFSEMPPRAPLAPVLARSLDALLALKKASGYAGDIGLRQGQDDAGGAAYELGLGARLLVPNDFVDAFADAVVSQTDQKLGTFAGVARSYRAMLAQPGAKPGLVKLMEPLGFSTARQLSPDEVYLSHLPVGTTDIDGPAVLVTGTDATYTFVDPLFRPDGVAQALAESADVTGLVGDVRDSAAIKVLLATIPDHEANPPQRLFDGRFNIRDQKVFASALDTIVDTMSGIELQGNEAQKLRNGDEAAWNQLFDFAFALADRGIPALCVLMRENGNVLIAASVQGMPHIGSNLTARQATSLRWAAFRLDTESQTGAQLSQGGARRDFTFRQAPSGLWCILLTTYRRQGLTDPLEVRPRLPIGVTIDYPAYERMMNVLAASCPVGVEINTWSIRQRHVRLDPAAPQGPLNVSASRSFRRFRQARFAGPAVGDDNTGDQNG